MARQIRKSLLIHEIVVKKVTGQDAFQNPTYTENTLNNVRVLIGSDIVKKSIYSDTQIDCAIMWDFIRSTSYNWEEKDVVVFEGKEYEIHTIKDEPTTKKHHLEIYGKWSK